VKKDYPDAVAEIATGKTSATQQFPVGDDRSMFLG
jgi:hypothetical protein